MKYIPPAQGRRQKNFQEK